MLNLFCGFVLINLNSLRGKTTEQQRNSSCRASLVAQKVKNLPVMQKTWIQPLALEDSLEKRMATYSSILAWRIPWTVEPGGLQSMGLQRDTTERLTFSLFTFQTIIEYA